MEEDLLAGFDEFVDKETKEADSISSLDTSTFDEADQLDHKIKKAETQKHINLLNSQRGERPDEDVDLDIDRAKLVLKQREKELIAEYKPVPTNEPAPEKSLTDKSIEFVGDFNDMTDDMLDGIIAPFVPQLKLGTNLVAKMGNFIGGAGEDIVNFLTDSNIDEYDKLREINKIQGAMLNETLDPQGKALMTPTDTAEIIATLIPIGQSARAFATAEGAIAGASEYQKEGGIGDAIESAGTAVAFSLAGAKIADMMFGGGKVPTKFAKEIKKLGKDDEIALNNVLDNLDAKDIQRMDEPARNKVMDDVMSGKMSEEEISESVLKSLDAQYDEATAVVKNAYEAANDKVDKGNITPVKQAFIDAFKKSDGTDDEVKALDFIKRKLKPKKEAWKELNAEDIEPILKDLKKQQRKPDAAKHVYGQAIETLQKMQDEIGGVGLYKEARDLAKQKAIDFSGKIKGRGGKAGQAVGKVREERNLYNIGQQLLNKDIDKNQIGKAVKGLSENNKMQIVQDLLSKDVGDITTPDGVLKVVDNYNKIGEGLELLIGDKAAKKLRLNMDTIATIESSILSANKVDTGVAQEILDIATAASMVHLSPFLAAKSTVRGINKIIGKKMTAAERNALLARTKTIKDKPLRQKITRAIAVLTTPNGFEDVPKATVSNTVEETKVDSTKPITEKVINDSPKDKTNHVDDFNSMFPKATSVEPEKKESTVVYGRNSRTYSGVRPSGGTPTGSTSGTNPPMPKNAPRNVSNNNLGNIKHNSNNNWKGQTEDNKDKTFVSFKTPEDGVRALKKIINANINATNSIETYVNRYASEPKEKAYYAKHGKLMPHLQNYAKVIASSQGIDNIKSMPKSINMKKWIKATAIAEGGGKALRYFTDEVIERGIKMT
jgi:hypothetical protein